MDKFDEMAAEWGKLPSELREWAEKCGYENLKGRIEVGGLIASQAATTLAILLAGAGGALAYGIKILEPDPSALVCGAAWVCLYLAILAVLLVACCVNLEGAPPLYSEPKKLLMNSGSLEAIRLGELANLQERIEHMKARNERRARILDVVRWGALATPILFALVVLYYR